MSFPKKIYINSAYRSYGKSDSDFSVQLTGLKSLPENMVACISDIVLENIFYTIESTTNKIIIESSVTVVPKVDEYYQILLTPGYYNVIQFIEMLRSSTIYTSNYKTGPFVVSSNVVSDLFTVTDPYTSVGDPYKIKITRNDNGYFAIVENTTGSVFPIENPLSQDTEKYNLSYNMNGYNCFFIRCSQLSSFNTYVSGKKKFTGEDISGASSIIKKVPINVRHGYTIFDSNTDSREWFDVSHKDLTTLDFKITDYEGNILDLKGTNISFSIIFDEK